MTNTDAPPAKPSFFTTTTGRIILVIVACAIVANGIRAVWSLTRTTQDRINADVAALREAPNDRLREEAMKALGRYRDSDRPPVPPVVEVASAQLKIISGKKANYNSQQFGFFLWAVQYLGRHDTTGESLELLQQIEGYIPDERISTGYKHLQQRALLARSEITLRTVKEAQQRMMDGLQKPIGQPPP